MNESGDDIVWGEPGRNVQPPLAGREASLNVIDINVIEDIVEYGDATIGNTFDHTLGNLGVKFPCVDTFLLGFALFAKFPNVTHILLLNAG